MCKHDLKESLWEEDPVDPNEFEYGFNHSIFKDPSAPPRQKAQKIVHQQQVPPSAGGFITAGSNESDVVEFYPSSPEISDAEDEADVSAGINSLNIGGRIGELSTLSTLLILEVRWRRLFEILYSRSLKEFQQ